LKKQKMSPRKVRCIEALSRGELFMPSMCTMHPMSLTETRTGACLGHLAFHVAMSPRVRYERSGAYLYRDNCDVHGVSLFSFETDKCVTCFTEGGAARTNSRNGTRALARKAGHSGYTGTCPTHGTTAHSVAHGKCLTCFTMSGAARLGTGERATPRSEARKAGQAHYLATCPTHGITAHSVPNGKCLTCFTTAGTVRLGSGQRATPRSEARSAGLLHYLATCPTHGDTLHSVGHGKCLECFTTAGLERRGENKRARADARRAGDTSYDATCATHGPTPHSVAHGKCLRCFTATGAVRKNFIIGA
jgi:hypothetical protein